VARRRAGDALLGGGDPGREAAQRDRVLTLAAPFTGEPATMATLAWRYAGIAWGSDGLALIQEDWWKTRRTRVWMLRPGSQTPEVLFDRSSEDRYADPGFPLQVPNAWGRAVLQTADGGRTIFLSGEGASTEGDRPFLDALDLTTKKTRRLFRSEAPYYEDPLALLGTDGRYLLVRREAVEEPPNYFIRDLKTKQLRQVTRFPHPTPQLLGIHKELLRYARPDGVQLTATLYTPAGWKPADGPLPTVMWVYPQEFKSASAAGQVNDSPYRFVRAGWWSPVLWLTQGYAVVDNPSLPIVGEGDKEPNDSYVDQLVASAKAAVDEVVRRGVTDPRRVAIGGHSYGAFTTANLLAHSDLFAAGIAESGAYNRTLTPFGFQAEERDFWHASDIYMKMSPFLYANQIRRPLLLVHGQADNNPGTDPIQSDRFYSALKGNGATVRLVVLPYESHGYRARESVLHLLWESSNWLDTYVKNRPAEESKPAAAKQ
jgi:dipeptidyl aminopeptidase/acylaminoacyl peptidase